MSNGHEYTGDPAAMCPDADTVFTMPRHALIEIVRCVALAALFASGVWNLATGA